MNRGVEEPFEETLQTTSRRLFMPDSDFPTTTLPDRCPVACLISQWQSSESPARDDVIRLTSWRLARRTGLRASPTASRCSGRPGRIVAARGHDDHWQPGSLKLPIRVCQPRAEDT